MKEISGGLEQIPGYSFSAMECGIRYKNRLDYCLIASNSQCNVSGVFTTNRIYAAPVRLCMERIENPVRAILINATNANACTGEEGYRNALQLTGAVAEILEADKESVLMASTGIIGQQLPLDKMMKAIPGLINLLSPDNGSLIPMAIMTTDTFPKSIACGFSTSLGDFKLAGTAKGSGMIAPDMATLLSFIITDCPVEKKALDQLFKNCINKTLNAITIDGDMSTNDTALILSPVSDCYIENADDINEFENALEFILLRLSRMLVTDGEGATKFVTINVKGAKDDNDARKIAKAVSESLLVKTAFFGNDPNWGRIACAAGYSGASVFEEKLSIYIENIPLLEKGIPSGSDRKTIEHAISGKEFSVLVDVGIGNGSARYFTSDISYDYVKINAEYTT